MITLTIDPEKVNSETSGRLLTFSQDVVVIGDGAAGAVDISFPKEGLHQNHVKLTARPEGFWAINQANDPFVTLNGQPFGKRRLQPGDLLQIRRHVLQIHTLTTHAAPIAPSTPISVPLYEEESANALHFPDVDALAQEENPDSWFPLDTATLTQAREPGAVAPVTNKKSRWKRRALFFGLPCILLIIIGAETYLRAAGRSDNEEMRAAEGLADLAMALMYAKVYQVAPHTQNWSDPQFLRNNLFDLLSSASIPSGNIDLQGQFCNCPYILRFYTDQDLDHFVLIAQPASSLVQWLTPRRALVIDSNLMTLHRTSDLKGLNRLLLAQDPLEGANGEELKQLIEKGERISLEALSRGTGKRDFAPPVALKYLRPGAENFLYNAPRYHQLSTTFVKQLMMADYEQQPQLLFHSQYTLLKRFPDLILYTKGGLVLALTAQKALERLGLSSSFLSAYVRCSAKKSLLCGYLTLGEPRHIELPQLPTTMVTIQENHPSFLTSTHVPSSFALFANEAQLSLVPLLQRLHLLLENTLAREELFLPKEFDQLLAHYRHSLSRVRQELDKQLHDTSLSSEEKHHLLRQYGLLDLHQEEPLIAEAPPPTPHWHAFQNIIQLFPTRPSPLPTLKPDSYK